MTSQHTYRVVILLLQLSLLLLLPLGFHLHGLSYQVSQNGDWLGLADERVLDIHKGKKKGVIVVTFSASKGLNKGSSHVFLSAPGIYVLLSSSFCPFLCEFLSLP